MHKTGAFNRSATLRYGTCTTILLPTGEKAQRAKFFESGSGPAAVEAGLQGDAQTSPIVPIEMNRTLSHADIAACNVELSQCGVRNQNGWPARRVTVATRPSRDRLEAGSIDR